MKNFLQALLIFFSLCLCGLVAFQWVRETDLRKKVQSLTDSERTKMELNLAHEATIRRTQEEVRRLDDIRKNLNEELKTNRAAITILSRDLETATTEADRWLKQSDVYKDALQKANENIVKQNEDIRKQNEDLKKLADDRNEMVNRFNKVAADYNELVAKWNKQQEELAQAATNAPPQTAKEERRNR